MATENTVTIETDVPELETNVQEVPDVSEVKKRKCRGKGKKMIKVTEDPAYFLFYLLPDGTLKFHEPSEEDMKHHKKWTPNMRHRLNSTITTNTSDNERSKGRAKRGSFEDHTVVDISDTPETQYPNVDDFIEEKRGNMKSVY